MNDFFRRLGQEFLKHKPVIVFDDPQREGEADLIFPADKMTPEIVTLMITYGKGLLCVGLTQTRREELNLSLLREHNDTKFHTNFLMPVDVKDGLTTGISSRERAHTIRALGDFRVGASEFTRPGHVFPLLAHTQGLAGRGGHTEAAVTLAEQCGFAPAGALIEILDEQGDNHNVDYIYRLAEKFGLQITSVGEVYAECQKLG